jgi:hypothetical protein
MLVMSMEARSKVLEEEDAEKLSSIGIVGLAIELGGKYEEAEAMHGQELARKEKVLGHEHPDTLTSMNNLAGVLDSQGKYEEAEAMHRQTLARKNKVPGICEKLIARRENYCRLRGRVDRTSEREAQVAETRDEMSC